MNMRFIFALLAGLAFAAPALADGGPKTETPLSAVQPALQACPANTLERKLNVAQTSPSRVLQGSQGRVRLPRRQDHLL